MLAEYLHSFLFGLYPYLCAAVFLIGSLIRFDRDQYTWRSSSSQLLRTGQLRWGSNLFHIGILFLFFGHLVGLLTPSSVYTLVVDVPTKQLFAIVSGGTAGLLCFVGLTMLLHRRLADPRIRRTSTKMDIFVLALLWVQLALGIVTLPFSLGHRDGSMMVALSHWAQYIVTFRAGAADFVAAAEWPFKVHLVLGMTLFLVFPFTRLVHIWSAPVWYLFRRYQVVRRRDAASAVMDARRT